MDLFLENAQRIFDVARSDENGEPNDFVLFIRPDGSLHFAMQLEPGESLPNDPVQTTYRVTRTANGRVRVAGKNGFQECILEQQASLPASPAELLRDRPLYWMTSPVTTSAAS